MLVFEEGGILYTIEVHDANVTVDLVKLSNFVTLDLEPDKKGKLWPSLHSGFSEDMSIGIDADSLPVNYVVLGAYSEDSKDDVDKPTFSNGFVWSFKG